MEEEILRIEKKYPLIQQTLYNLIKGSWLLDSSAVDETFNSILSFLSKIELLYEDAKKLYDKNSKYYFERSYESLEFIRNGIRGSAGVLHFIDINDYEWVFKKFSNIRNRMYTFFEDIKMIYAIRVIPIEEKIALKSRLSNYGFVEVVKALDEAESNLAMRKPEHLKDCVDGSREGLEKTAALILAAENKKPSGSFATDMGTLSGLGLIKKEPKRLIEAPHSHLSEVGSHGRAGEVTLGDAALAMKVTYIFIGALLERYAAHLARKRRS